jgi:putative membrane protein
MIHTNEPAILIEALEDRRLLSVVAAATNGQNSRDANWLKKTSSAEMKEITLGNLAQTNALNAQVKNFGSTLVNDHTTAKQQLTQVATSLSVTLPSELSRQDQAVITRFSKLNGDDFDRAFSSYMIQDHKKDIKDFQQENNRTSDASIQNFTTAQIPILQTHLSIAEDTFGVVAQTRGDTSFVLKDLSGNRLEIMLGNTAQTNATSAQVKQFGATMVSDHSTSLANLQSIAASLGIEDPGTLSAKDQRDFDRLSSLTGAAFDKAYINFMVQDHKKEIPDHQRENKRTKNTQLQSYTDTVIPVLQTHLQLAQAAQDAVQAET